MRPGLAVEPLGEEWPQYAHPTRPEFLLTRPDRDRTSGFFIARLAYDPGMSWTEWVRGAEVEPSLYGADFAHLGDQVDALLDGGCRVFHFDVGDGHFVEPITMGPIVLQAIAPRVHERGGAMDVHLMVENPAKYFEPVAKAGGDSVTFHFEAVDDVPATIAAARAQGLQAGVAFNPETSPDDVAAVAAEADLVLCMSIHPGLLRAAVPGRRRSGASRGCASCSRSACTSRSTAESAPRTSRAARERRDAARRRVVDLRGRRSAAARTAASCRRSVDARARRRARARRPRPCVSEADRRRRRRRRRRGRRRRSRPRRRGRHAEVVALAAAGERARDATLYVSLEPCNHHGTTPPCTEAILAAGIARVVYGAADPNPKAAGGAARLRREGVDVELVDSFEARAAERGAGGRGSRSNGRSSSTRRR